MFKKIQKQIKKEQEEIENSYYEINSSTIIIGNGSYGKVIKTIDLNNKYNDVAVKIIESNWKNDPLQYCLCLYREVYMLKQLSHPNIIKLIDVKAPNYNSSSIEQYNSGGYDGSIDTLQYVFECADTDLSTYLEHRLSTYDELSEFEVQYIMYQLLLATQYIHSANIIHRDIKPQNILIFWNSLTVKLADFGLARIISTDSNNFNNICDSPTYQKYSSSSSYTTELLSVPKLESHLTQHVVTRWYRAPEVILLQPYDTSLDIWSLGCVFADLLSCGTPLFPGSPVGILSSDSRYNTNNDENNMLVKIFRVLGGPTDEDIMTFPEEEIRNELINYQSILPEQTMGSRYPHASDLAINFLENMIQFIPSRRIKIQYALMHQYFEGIRYSFHEADSVHPSKLKMDISSKVVNERAQKENIGRLIMSEINHFRENNKLKYSISPTSDQKINKRSYNKSFPNDIESNNCYVDLTNEDKINPSKKIMASYANSEQYDNDDDDDDDNNNNFTFSFEKMTNYIVEEE